MLGDLPVADRAAGFAVELEGVLRGDLEEPGEALDRDVLAVSGEDDRAALGLGDGDVASGQYRVDAAVVEAAVDLGVRGFAFLLGEAALLDDRVRILNRSRKASQRIITADEVLARYGVTPTQWPAFRALTGDKSDNIPGVRGIGPKVAATLLHDGMRLPDLPESGRLTGAKGTAITTAWADVLRWESMITVRRHVDVPVALSGEASPQLPKPADVVEKLGLW
ncbi:5'-3' exonuclease H3TH domain-containing protein [Kitasatospora sp. NPDC091335]|uniref:5'-3' exonuclease H3TH domain-containing protein n=1 Tax=Kitasatospora sp. NPDC091335 TaxID=3364085 RepID=UPI0037F6A2AE